MASKSKYKKKKKSITPESFMTPRQVEPGDWDPVYDKVKGMHIWKDMLCLPCMLLDLLEDVVDGFQFEAGDVLLTSYPQSSFFWVQDVLWHLHNLDTLDVPVEEKASLSERVPFLEHKLTFTDPRDVIRTLPTPRLLKTHLAHRFWGENLAPVRNKVKVILWTAEPKDVMVNYCDYWNIKGEYFKFPKIGWSHFFDLFMKEHLFEGDWYEMNLSWLREYEEETNLLVLTYEESRRNLRGGVRKIAEFLGIPVTAEQVEKIAAMRSFDIWPEWSRMFNQQQKRLIDEKTKEKLKATSLSRFYPVDFPGKLNGDFVTTDEDEMEMMKNCEEDEEDEDYY